MLAYTGRTSSAGKGCMRVVLLLIAGLGATLHSALDPCSMNNMVMFRANDICSVIAICERTV